MCNFGDLPIRFPLTDSTMDCDTHHVTQNVKDERIHCFLIIHKLFSFSANISRSQISKLQRENFFQAKLLLFKIWIRNQITIIHVNCQSQNNHAYCIFQWRNVETFSLRDAWGMQFSENGSDSKIWVDYSARFCSQYYLICVSDYLECNVYLYGTQL